METISGYMRFNPEMKYTIEEKALTTFNLHDNPDDAKPSKFSHRIVTWEDLAELCNAYLVSGDNLYVKGYWKARSWKTSDNQMRTINEFTARNVCLVLNGEYLDLGSLSEEKQEILDNRHYDYYTIPITEWLEKWQKGNN